MILEFTKQNNKTIPRPGMSLFLLSCCEQERISFHQDSEHVVWSDQYACPTSTDETAVLPSRTAMPPNYRSNRTVHCGTSARQGSPGCNAPSGRLTGELRRHIRLLMTGQVGQVQCRQRRDELDPESRGYTEVGEHRGLTDDFRHVRPTGLWYTRPLKSPARNRTHVVSRWLTDCAFSRGPGRSNRITARD